MLAPTSRGRDHLKSDPYASAISTVLPGGKERLAHTREESAIKLVLGSC